MHMKSADANTVIVPGHGTLYQARRHDPVSRHGPRRAAEGQGLIAQGKTLQEVLAAKVTAPYDAKTAGGTDASATRFITEMYQELKGK